MIFVCVADASDLLNRAHRNSYDDAREIQIRDDALTRHRYPLSCWNEILRLFCDEGDRFQLNVLRVNRSFVKRGGRKGGGVLQ